jgi:hypothetical protein
MIKLKDLLKEGESETVEFKPSLSQMDKIIESISAFSNTKGGTATTDLKQLVLKGLLTRVGEGKRNIQYVLPDYAKNYVKMKLIQFERYSHTKGEKRYRCSLIALFQREERKAQLHKSLYLKEIIRPGTRMTRIRRIYTDPCAFHNFFFREQIENHENHSN